MPSSPVLAAPTDRVAVLPRTAVTETSSPAPGRAHELPEDPRHLASRLGPPLQALPRGSGRAGAGLPSLERARRRPDDSESRALTGGSTAARRAAASVLVSGGRAAEARVDPEGPRRHGEAACYGPSTRRQRAVDEGSVRPGLAIGKLRGNLTRV